MEVSKSVSIKNLIMTVIVVGNCKKSALYYMTKNSIVSSKALQVYYRLETNINMFSLNVLMPLVFHKKLSAIEK